MKLSGGQNNEPKSETNQEIDRKEAIKTDGIEAEKAL